MQHAGLSQWVGWRGAPSDGRNAELSEGSTLQLLTTRRLVLARAISHISSARLRLFAQRRRGLLHHIIHKPTDTTATDTNKQAGQGRGPRLQREDDISTD